MSTGIRATIEFSTPGLCPLLDASAAAETHIRGVSRSVCASNCSASVTEFSTSHEFDSPEIIPVFEHGESNRYRLRHDDPIGCPCESLGELGCAVSQYIARKGSLTIVFFASDYDELRSAIAVLRERFPGLDLKRLIQSPTNVTHEDTVLVDRGRLTARQREVIRTAYEEGYFERPRRANATEIAAMLDIDPSTFGEHLTAAQGKLLQDVFETHE